MESTAVEHVTLPAHQDTREGFLSRWHLNCLEREIKVRAVKIISGVGKNCLTHKTWVLGTYSMSNLGTYSMSKRFFHYGFSDVKQDEISS